MRDPNARIHIICKKNEMQENTTYVCKVWWSVAAKHCKSLYRSAMDENTTVYDATLSTVESDLENKNIKIFPNPTSDFIAIQIGGLNLQDLNIEMYDMQGKLIQEKTLKSGQTIGYFDIQTLYSGTYLIKISTNNMSLTRKVIVEK